MSKIIPPAALLVCEFFVISRLVKKTIFVEEFDNDDDEAGAHCWVVSKQQQH